MNTETLKNKRIIFFDGICHLCNGFVDRIISLDQAHKLSFAPLQGETAALLLPKDKTELLSSIVYYDQGRVFERSEAILEISKQLPFPHSALGVFKVIPSILRDRVYKTIADNRYSWFGQREFCRLPEKDEREYLLP